jgi:hypothetical protein
MLPLLAETIPRMALPLNTHSHHAAATALGYYACAAGAFALISVRFFVKYKLVDKLILPPKLAMPPGGSWSRHGGNGSMSSANMLPIRINEDAGHPQATCSASATTKRADRPTARYRTRIDPPDQIAGGATAREENQ